MSSSPSKKHYVALLRGINLGSRNRVPMARLREICEAAGCEQVRTYIASGNVVLKSAEAGDVLARRLERAIESEFGINVAVVVLTAAQLADVVKRNPFGNAEQGTLHVAFAAKPISSDDATRLKRLSFPPEELVVAARHIYFHLPHGYGRAALPGEIDRICGKTTTVRNWRTVVALKEMA